MRSGQPQFYRSIGCIQLVQLALESSLRGRNFGIPLVLLASAYALAASNQIGGSAIILHASEPTLIPFYRKAGFEVSHESEMFLKINEFEQEISKRTSLDEILGLFSG